MTNLVKREPNGVRNRLFSPFLEDFFNIPLASWESSHWPRVDVRETTDEVTLLFEVPGMQKEDFDIQVENNRLIVSGERRMESDESEDGWIRREIATGSFQRQFTLPASIDQQSIQAEYKNGILRLKLAKREEAKPKQIEVKVS